MPDTFVYDPRKAGRAVMTCLAVLCWALAALFAFLCVFAGMPPANLPIPLGLALASSLLRHCAWKALNVRITMTAEAVAVENLCSGEKDSLPYAGIRHIYSLWNGKRGYFILSTGEMSIEEQKALIWRYCSRGIPGNGTGLCIESDSREVRRCLKTYCPHANLPVC